MPTDESTDATGEPEDEDRPSDADRPTPTDDEVVETAAAAAENLIFTRLSPSDVADYDVTVTFEDGILDLDVYVDAPDATDDEQVAEDAALAARSAVDDLFAASE